MAFLRRHPFALFLLHQVVVFGCGMAFLVTVRALSGRTLHGARDPLGALDGAAYFVLVALIVAGTVWLWSRVREPSAPPLGLAPSVLRLWRAALGCSAGFALNAVPWLGALLFGSARVETWSWDALPAGGVALALAVGLAMGIGNAFLEEATSRAFPLRVLERWRLRARIAAAALAFAAQHLVDEGFAPARFLYLTSLGVIFAAAYAHTGDVYLGFGLHLGWYLASVVPAGRWHAGSLFALEGSPMPSYAVIDGLLLLVALSLWIAAPRFVRETR